MTAALAAAMFASKISRQWFLVMLVLIGGSADAARAEPKVRISASDDIRTYVRLSVDGAMHRLTRQKCQTVFSDFSLTPPDRSELPLIWFVGDDEASQCQRSE